MGVLILFRFQKYIFTFPLDVGKNQSLNARVYVFIDLCATVRKNQTGLKNYYKKIKRLKLGVRKLLGKRQHYPS